MLGAVKATYVGVRFGPHNKIKGHQIESGRSREDDGLAAPIDECAEHAAIAKVRQCRANPGHVESEELITAAFRQMPCRNRDAHRG